jgi:hypothetical protein
MCDGEERVPGYLKGGMMFRILSSGLLIGYDNVAFWFVLPLIGTLVANAIWFLIWALVEWSVPDSRKVKAAREEDRQTILHLKAKLCDTALELVKTQKSNAALRDVAEEMRNSNRNLNARASEALR